MSDLRPYVIARSNGAGHTAYLNAYYRIDGVRVAMQLSADTLDQPSARAAVKNAHREIVREAYYMEAVDA